MEETAKSKSEITPTINSIIGVEEGNSPPTPLGIYQGLYRKDIPVKWKKVNGKNIPIEFRHEYYALVRVDHEARMRVELKKLIQNLHLEKLTPTLLLIPLDLAKVCKDGSQRMGKRSNRKRSIQGGT